ncbi:hypothetical protein R3P38DRAFT_3312228 [Favolaschia claudopus]|uniref:DUF6534 domain-containing protein n=1 Tax=Favolaschia claudopus TaxID=2862362 RepID=A0AAW0C796_9AGAR
MTAATLDSGAPLGNTMGSMLLGVIFSAILYGISLLQCLFYFTRYKRDPIYLKVIVTLTLFLDTFHLSLVVHTLYHYLISNYYQREALRLMIWSVSLEAVPTGLTAGLVQITPTSYRFYAYRIWRMSHRNYFATGFVLVLVLATNACGTAWALTITINALSAAADVYITAMMCLMLRQSNPESVETKSMVNKLIAFTINTGLICAVASLISLILSPRTLIYASFYFCIGRMYSNALLASLNARTIIRGRITGVDSNPLHHINVKASRNGSASAAAARRLSRDVFVRPGDIEIDVVSTAGAGDEPLAVRIDRRTEMYADGDGSYSDRKSAFTSTESQHLPK